MNNHKSRMYVDGTAALKIDHSRSRSENNVVRLGRAQDGSLVVARRKMNERQSLQGASCNEVFSREEQRVSSLRDDLRIAFDAMGFKAMERNFFEGSSASRSFPKVGAFPVVASSAFSFVFTALMFLL